MWSSSACNLPQAAYFPQPRTEHTLFGKENMHMTQGSQFRQLVTRLNFCRCFIETKAGSFVVGWL